MVKFSYRKLTAFLLAGLLPSEGTARKLQARESLRMTWSRSAVWPNGKAAGPVPPYDVDMSPVCAAAASADPEPTHGKEMPSACAAFLSNLERNAMAQYRAALLLADAAPATAAPAGALQIGDLVYVDMGMAHHGQDDMGRAGLRRMEMRGFVHLGTHTGTYRQGFARVEEVLTRWGDVRVRWEDGHASSIVPVRVCTRTEEGLLGGVDKIASNVTLVQAVVNVAPAPPADKLSQAKEENEDWTMLESDMAKKEDEDWTMLY